MKRIIYLFVFLSSLGITKAQIITTVAGNGIQGYNGDNILATSAQLYEPTGVAVDTSGNIYFADEGNSRIRKVTVSTGIITTIAGTGINGYSADSVPALSADINPIKVALDRSGNVYFIDDLSTIRKITISSGLLTIFAGGNGEGYNGDNIPATSAKLYEPSGIAIDSLGNLYIADWINRRIRKVTASTGIITTIAGTGTIGFNGDNIAATTAQLWNPLGVAVDDSGNVYIADQGTNRIRKITASTGLITTVAGTGTAGYNGDNILATISELSYCTDVSVDSLRNILICDQNNYRLRKVTSSTGMISTYAGNGTIGYNGDNILATSAELNTPWGSTTDSYGNVYIADMDNNRIRKITNCTNMQTPFLTINGDTSFCNGNSVIFNPGNFTSYVWSTGSSTQSIIIDSANTYRVTVSNLNGCTKTDSVVVTINPIPTPTISGDSVICEGSLSILTTGLFVQYNWSTGSTNQTTIATIANTYIVTVTNGNGCTGTASQTVIVNPLPTPAITSNGPDTFCQGNSVILNTGVYSSYSWNNLSTTQSITATISGIYIVTVTDFNYCTGTASQTIVVIPLVSVTSFFHSDTTKGCTPFTVNFKNTSTNGTSYLWNFGDNTTDTAKNPTHTYLDSGSYTIKLIVTNVSPCGKVKDSITLIDYILVNVFKPVASFTSDYVIPIYVGDSIHFKDGSYDPTSGYITLWQWWFGDGQGSNFLNPIHTWDLPGMYQVTLIVTNNQGCKDSTIYDYIEVIEGLIDIPNTFTPNNDGYNDFFEIKASGIENYSLQIFNRWGILLFETTSTEINWDGYNQSGLQCPDGTYFYVLKATAYSGKDFSRAGFIMLLR